MILIILKSPYVFILYAIAAGERPCVTGAHTSRWFTLSLLLIATRRRKRWALNILLALTIYAHRRTRARSRIYICIIQRREITHELSLSLSFFSRFLLVFHVDRHEHESSRRCLLVHTRRRRTEKVRAATTVIPRRTTERTASTFSLDDNASPAALRLSALWNSEGEMLRLLVLGPEGTARESKKDRQKGNEIKVRQQCTVRKKRIRNDVIFFA